MAVVKTIRNRSMILKDADFSHRVLLETKDSAIKQGSVTPQWVRINAERRKRDKANWTLNEWVSIKGPLEC